jgi:hypothetical protein
MEMLKGFGYAVVAKAFVGLGLVPDPIGKIVEIWRFSSEETGQTEISSESIPHPSLRSLVVARAAV